MRRILSGIETEYGLLISGRGADSQVDDAMALVRGYPDECLVAWDYRYESPRSDLRGFRLEKLAYDPEDAKFDEGKVYGQDGDIRSDRILPNGARFYNDHGHPEYSTPECFSLQELAAHDCAGQRVVLRAAAVLAKKTEVDVTVYKNNTDFHGASYGTHENYSMPRSLGFEPLFRDLTPMLVARQILVGAGKVGSETGRAATYQLSQRADFFSEAANAETLFRRPVFNTRDEPHADPREWIRVHVIAGDANMIPAASARKVGLAKLALHLCEEGTAPLWKMSNPVLSFQDISRDESYAFRVELDGRSWTTGYEILESYFAAAERTLELDDDMRWVIDSSRKLLADLHDCPDRFRRQVDWAAKKAILEQFMESEGSDWRDPSLRAYDLEYHNVDPDDGLHSALVQMDEVESDPSEEIQLACLQEGPRDTRAFARGLAVSKFKDQVLSACWNSITFKVADEAVEVTLPPEGDYAAQLKDAADVGSFIEMLRGIK